jgi:hypothetical protein
MIIINDIQSVNNLSIINTNGVSVVILSPSQEILITFTLKDDGTFSINTLSAPGQTFISSGAVLYLNKSVNVNVDPLPSLYQLGNLPDGLSQSTDITSVNKTNSTKQIAKTFITNSNYPGTVLIPAGQWDFNIWCSGDSSKVSMYGEIWKCDANGGNGALLGTTSSIPVPQSTPTQIILSVLINSINMTTTSRIEAKIYITTTSGSTANVTTYFEGNQFYSHIHTPLSSYVPSNARPYYQVTSTPYTIQSFNSIIGVNIDSAVLILPSWSSCAPGQTFIISNESGGAIVNITINVTGTDTINGVSSRTISSSYGSCSLYVSSTVGAFIVYNQLT